MFQCQNTITNTLLIPHNPNAKPKAYQKVCNPTLFCTIVQLVFPNLNKFVGTSWLTYLLSWQGQEF